jgi:hypothetical protein
MSNDFDSNITDYYPLGIFNIKFLVTIPGHCVKWLELISVEEDNLTLKKNDKSIVEIKKQSLAWLVFHAVSDDKYIKQYNPNVLIHDLRTYYNPRNVNLRYSCLPFIDIINTESNSISRGQLIGVDQYLLFFIVQLIEDNEIVRIKMQNYIISNENVVDHLFIYQWIYVP